MARSLSRPRRKHPAALKAEDRSHTSTSHVTSSQITKDLPPVPTLPPLPILDPVDSDATPPPQDVGQPGPAISPEALQALHIFELAAEPISSDEEREASFENPLIRRRSLSSATPDSRAPRPLSKKASWFRVGTGRDKALPPPPPPTGPLPPVPGPQQQQRQQEYKKPGTARSDTSAPDSSPQVPSLFDGKSDTSASSIATASEAGSFHQPASPTIDQRPGYNGRNRKVPCPVQTMPVRGHRYKDSAIVTPRSPHTPLTPHTPTGIMRWTKQTHEGEQEGLGVHMLPDEEQQQRSVPSWTSSAPRIEMDETTLPSSRFE